MQVKKKIGFLASNVIFQPEFTCTIEDGAPPLPPAPLPAPAPAPAPAPISVQPTTDWKAKYEEAARKSQTLEERFAGLEAKFGATEGLQVELEAVKKKAEAQTARLKLVDDAQAKTTQTLFEKIPEDARKKLEPFKATMDPIAWHDFVTVQAAMLIVNDDDDTENNDDDNGPPKPPSKGKRKDAKIMAGRYKPKFADEIEDELGVEVTMLPNVIADKHAGGTTFRINRKAYRALLTGKSNFGVKLTKENADKRDT